LAPEPALLPVLSFRASALVPEPLSVQSPAELLEPSSAVTNITAIPAAIVISSTHMVRRITTPM
jgi:hypothetical protein